MYKLIDGKEVSTHVKTKVKEEVELLKNMVKEKIPCKDINIGYIGPIVGGTIGPDAVVLSAFGKDVTFKAEESK